MAAIAAHRSIETNRGKASEDQDAPRPYVIKPGVKPGFMTFA